MIILQRLMNFCLVQDRQLLNELLNTLIILTFVDGLIVKVALSVFEIKDCRSD